MNTVNSNKVNHLQFMINLHDELFNDNSRMVMSVGIDKNSEGKYMLEYVYFDVSQALCVCKVFQDQTAKIYIIDEDAEDGELIFEFENYQEALDRIIKKKIEI